MSENYNDDEIIEIFASSNVYIDMCMVYKY